MTVLDAAHAAAQRLLATTGAVDVLAKPTADGIAAAAVFVTGLAAAGRPFHVRFTRETNLTLDDPVPRVLLGLGTGEAVLAIDHRHDGVPKPGLLSGRALGIPMRDASTGTLALAVAVALHPSAWSAAPAALAGAWSEGHGLPSFTGWNADVLEVGRKGGTLATRPGFLVDDRPIIELLTSGAGLLQDTPFDATAATHFLAKHRLPGQATVHELAPGDVQRLATGLALDHLRGDRPPSDIARWFGPVPFDVARQLPVPRLASLLARAATHAESGLALAFLLGDASALAELESLPPPHRPLLIQGPP